MILKQVSVFIENKPGRIARVANILAENNIDLMALSISETPDYGIVRIIVDKPEETLALLKQNDKACKITEVLAVFVNDEPGSLTKILSVLAEHDIGITYTYAFFSRIQGKACIVLRVPDNEYAAEVLREAGVADC